MANLESDIRFVKEHGNIIELARLEVLLHREESVQYAVNQIRESQREDGGWTPFWSPDKSSVDATCYRLAQFEQLGVKNEDFISNALYFLLKRQDKDGFFAEADELESIAPPWAQPRDAAARLYLTANAAYWLKFYKGHENSLLNAVNFLKSNINTEGYLPTFLHANWMAAGLFYAINEQDYALSIMDYLTDKLAELNASNLAWMVNALVIMGVPTNTPLIIYAINKLIELQQEDGHWENEDGNHFNVHTTLESIRAFYFCN